MAKTARHIVVVVGLATVGLAGTASAAFGAEPELPAIRILVKAVAGVARPARASEGRNH
jgi:hypothetical protein